jgi:hypothetical protein
VTEFLREQTPDFSSYTFLLVVLTIFEGLFASPL